MDKLSLITLIATMLTVQSHSFVKSNQFCQLMQTDLPKTKLQLNSHQEKPPVTGTPDDRQPAGTKAILLGC